MISMIYEIEYTIASESVRHEINIAFRKKVRRVTQDILIPPITLRSHIPGIQDATTMHIASEMVLRTAKAKEWDP
jgi:hypothetical protein